MVVEVHVEAAGEGVAEGGDGRTGDVGGQDDLAWLLAQTTWPSLQLKLSFDSYRVSSTLLQIDNQYEPKDNSGSRQNSQDQDSQDQDD